MASIIWWCVRRFVFFFSSRRRHTRYIGDWSSDVCSSDLKTGKHRSSAIDGRTTRHIGYRISQSCRAMSECIFGWGKQHGTMRKTKHRGRSEERRVGKECRTSWTREPKKEQETSRNAEETH